MGFTGFTIVMPFLPLYIHQLGAQDEGEIAMWAGLSLGVTPAVTAVLAPFWGRVADRFGRKLMVERSLISFVIIMSATAFATAPWHVFALRAVQGLFAGYGGLTLAMAAESAPRDRLATAIGLVQTSQRLGPAIGPVLGGLLAGLVGIRNAFFVTAAFYALALVLVGVLYQDPAHLEGPADVTADTAPGWRSFLTAPGFPLVLVAIFGITFVDRSFGPILPLYVERLGVDGDRIAFVSGLLFSAAALGATLGNQVCDSLLRRWPAGRVITHGLGVAGVALGCFLISTSTGVLVATMALFGVGIGAATTAAYTAGGSQIPPRAHGAGFGVLTSSSLAGLAISPAVCGLLSRQSLLIVFGLDLGMLVVLAGLLAWRMPATAHGAAQAPPPSISEAADQ